MYKILFKYFLSNDVKIFLNLIENKVFFLGKFGKNFVFLPKYYLFYNKGVNMYFLFLMKQYFTSFVKHFIYNYYRVIKLFFFKIKLRGLGYYMKRMSKKLFKIFVANNHFYYFYSPSNIYIRRRGREFFFLSNNKSFLNDLFIHLLHLKKIDLYDKTNSFMAKNKVILFKKRK